ncbi:MAG: MFS transporter [Candidatus Eremiobacteraeota bacterium]|nr:MFS transporter [Candidatus Eremiobacteraeota bacterium]MCW5871958.1 MFS transporter [Candidatus Eremiobacteraeota bacterium]
MHRPLILIVLCHFLASFSVLGMSPYYPTLLERSYALKDPALGGVFYVIPLLVMGLAGPLWGWFADRFGQKLSLARAQLGLALALYLCSLAPNAWTFALCLALQGLFGGTFSASNALLAQYYQGAALSRGLCYLQYSARLGLFLAPSLLALVVLEMPDPAVAYGWLWLLPAASFGLLQTFLPRPGRPAETPTSLTPSHHPIPFAWLLAAEFWFTLMTVVTFPYFVKFFQAAQTGIPDRYAGFFFGTPHVVYLLLAFLVIGRARPQQALSYLVLAFAGFSLAMLGHLLPGAAVLLATRVLMGIALVYGYVYLNQLVGAAVRPHSAGKSFGWLDTASKFAGVFAGLLAGAAVSAGGLRAPFLLSALLGLPLTAAAWRTRRTYA